MAPGPGRCCCSAGSLGFAFEAGPASVFCNDLGTPAQLLTESMSSPDTPYRRAIRVRSANAAAASANAAAAAAGSVTMLSEDVRLPASIQPKACRHRSPGPARPGPQSPRPTDGPVPAAGPLTPDAGGGGGDAGGAGGALLDTLRRPEVAGYGAAWPASESRFAVPRVSARLPSKQERRAGSSVGFGSHEAAEQARTTPRSGQPPSPRCGGGFGGAGAARQGRQVGGLQAVSESQPQGEAQDPAPSAASALSHSCPLIPTVQI